MDSTPLRVIPLGGLGAIGRNMTLVEYDGRFLVIDAGLIGLRLPPGLTVHRHDHLVDHPRLGARQTARLTHPALRIPRADLAPDAMLKTGDSLTENERARLVPIRAEASRPMESARRVIPAEAPLQF